MILEPIEIKSMVLKNRIGFGPMLNQPHGPNGEVNEDTIKWYVTRAKGGVGFALTGTINPSVATYEEFLKTPPIGGLGLALTLHEDSYITGYKKLTEAVHQYGMKIGAQIGAGGITKGASSSPYPQKSITDVLFNMDIPVEEYRTEELEEIKKGCADTAARAKKAGFDCVELHTAHGYVSLWGGFMSPFTNRRTDKYGGSWENRLRYPSETIQAIREAVGENYPILVRISADELLGSAGVTLEDTLKYTIPIFEEAGVDCFDITMGSQLHNPNNIPTLYVPRGYYIYMPASVKKVTKVPVIGVGRILDMEMAERFIEEGKADIIYMGRQLIADPETPKKYFEGRSEDICKCIGDLPGFGGCLDCCAVNPNPPIMEGRDEVTPAEKPKKVLVIGGGVAGMESARVAALRGHKVTLVESEGSLGGVVGVLSNGLLNHEFKNLVDYLSNQIRKLNVDARVCKKVTADDVEELNPDVVIMATGATMTIPKAAIGKPQVLTHVDALMNMASIGNKIVIQGLGYGSELAISLAEAGKDVILFGKGDEIATNIPPLRRAFILKRLIDVNLCKGDGDIPIRKESNPKVLTGRTFVDVTSDGVLLEDKEGRKETFPYDTFIISMGRKSNDILRNDLKGKVPEFYQVGDCDEVGEIWEAMQSANTVAKQI